MRLRRMPIPLSAQIGGQTVERAPPYNLAKTSFEWSARIDRSELRPRGRNDASHAELKGRRAADWQGAAKGGATIRRQISHAWTAPGILMLSDLR
jgi:hypothetical protein